MVIDYTYISNVLVVAVVVMTLLEVEVIPTPTPIYVCSYIVTINGCRYVYAHSYLY